MKNITFKRGEIIVKEGSFDSTMYDIVSGRVGVFSAYGTAQEKKIAELDKEQIFGEIGLIGCYPRTATVVALEDGTTVTELTEADLEAYFQDKPEKLLKIMRQLSKRLRETTQNYYEVCRTIYENDRAERNGDPRSAWIAEHMDLYNEVFNSAQF